MLIIVKGTSKPGNKRARKRTFEHVRMGAFRIVKDAKFHHADNEDSDQTARMRRLI